jgi:four helix bundle protein
MAVVNYKDLQAWKLGIQLVKAVYQASNKWPSSELYGLISQSRRAAISIPANIAEGRAGRQRRTSHLSILGSLYGIETHL